MEHDPVWLVIGFLGQGLFTMRFVVQWLNSERIKRSVIPLAFWYFSLAGGATLLAYAIHRGSWSLCSIWSLASSNSLPPPRFGLEMSTQSRLPKGVYAG
jgi:lipid-A-disaccharide synthase-like uncharacterized protein